MIGLAGHDNLNVGHQRHNDASTVTVMQVMVSDGDAGKSGSLGVIGARQIQANVTQELKQRKIPISDDEG